MKQIDEARLEQDLSYRFEYLADFMGFTTDDIEAIHGAASVLAPLVPGLVDAVYDKLSGYDATWRHFVPRQDGYDGAVAADVETLTMDADVIKYRKQHLARYLERLVTAPYDEGMVRYLDTVGAMHTSARGNAVIDVPAIQMNALMGFVADAINATVLGLDLPADVQARTLRAFSKLLWLQNDLLVRHQVARGDVATAGV